MSEVKGETIDGLDVRHACDNPPCINPEHLVPGTRQDNVDDMYERGRARVGENDSKAKLSNAQVAEMRELRLQGWKLRELASRYGVCESHVSFVVRGKSRKHG